MSFSLVPEGFRYIAQGLAPIDDEHQYDVMLDLVESRSLSDCMRALTRRGTYVVVGVEDMGRWLGLGRQFKALLLSLFVRQRIRSC